jgi:glycosyltransferase involved in cell wall biosynthesis
MTGAPAFTILLPIHRPPVLAPYAVQSVLRQSRQDFELFIVCDGAPQATVEIARRFEAEDRRVRAFVHPKGARHGETYRHAALQQARGRFVCQIADDDLWFPDHLAEVAALMASADFGNTLMLYLHADGTPRLHLADLADPVVQKRLSGELHNIFGPTAAAYRLETYRGLPQGWSPAPDDIWTDLWMWRKFLALPGVRLQTRFLATSLSFPEGLRRNWTLERRREEIAAHAATLHSPEVRDRLWRDALGASARQLAALHDLTQWASAVGRRLLSSVGAAEDALVEIVAARGDTEAQARLAQAAIDRLPDSAWRRSLLTPPGTPPG